MMHAASRRLLAAAGALAVIWSARAGAVQIDGLTPLMSVDADGIRPMVSDGRLEIRLPGQTIIVNEWPSFLPQRFGSQTISAERHLHPAGPIDRVAFTRTADRRPWLIVGNGAGRSSELIRGWQLRLDETRWMVTDGRQAKPLGDGNPPVLIRDGDDVWCIYLLKATHPVAPGGIAAEGEARIAWAAIRLKAGRSHCA